MRQEAVQRDVHKQCRVPRCRQLPEFAEHHEFVIKKGRDTQAMLSELHQQFNNIRKLQEQVGHCRKIERSGRPGTAPAYGLRRARKNFKSHAANTASRKASNSSSGVRYPSFLRGRPFSSSAAERISSSEKASMEAPFGTKARSRPLCRSFCGRSQDV